VSQIPLRCLKDYQNLQPPTFFFPDEEVSLAAWQAELRDVSITSRTTTTCCCWALSRSTASRTTTTCSRPHSSSRTKRPSLAAQLRSLPCTTQCWMQT
ncbi:unnamed protein product, partial [Closterium sp. NIES-54]